MPTLFHKRVTAALADSQLQTTLARTTGRLRRARRQAFEDTTAFAVLQAAARELRRRTLHDLPSLLAQLEEQATANGVVVFWAEDAAAANRYILDLVKAPESLAGGQSRPLRVVKSRSPLADEIGLGPMLRAEKVPLVETHLGDYILQLDGDWPSHMVYPALHKRKEDVAQLFERELDMPQSLNVQAMAGMARFKLRRAILQAEVGISGVDFAVAQSGALALTSSSGNDRLVTTIPRLHVALMGIDRVVPTMTDLLLLLQLLSRSASDRPLINYAELIHGPAQAGDPDGPEALHLILLDNGRSDLLRLGYGDALGCIHCGACQNACPVYQHIGGHAYGSVHNGPIGAVAAPLMPMVPVISPEVERSGPWSVLRWSPPNAPGLSPLYGTPFARLPQASTLCGACADVCPVGIDIPHLLVRLRDDLHDAGRVSPTRRLFFRVWAWTMAGPRRYRLMARALRIGGRLWGRQRIRFLPPPFHSWTRGRDLPLPDRRPFHARWQDRQLKQDGKAIQHV